MWGSSEMESVEEYNQEEVDALTPPVADGDGHELGCLPRDDE